MSVLIIILCWKHIMLEYHENLVAFCQKQYCYFKIYQLCPYWQIKEFIITF